MLYLICTMISSVDLEHYRVSHATDWLSVDCGTSESESWHRPMYSCTEERDDIWMVQMYPTEQQHLK